jgi:hypothetical protein
MLEVSDRVFGTALHDPLWLIVAKGWGGHREIHLVQYRLISNKGTEKTYCFGVGVAAAFSGVGVAFGSFRASLRVSRPFLRASTRVRRRVFFSGDGDGDGAVTAPFAGLGVGSGSAAKTLDCAIKARAAARTRMCFIIIYIWFVVQVGGSFFPLKPGQPMLFSELIDQLQNAWAIACALQPRLDKPKVRACSDFFYSSPSAHSDKHLETHEVSKKICAR